MIASSGFFKKIDRRFLNGVSDDILLLQKMLSKRHKIPDPNFKKGDTIIGALLTGIGQNEQIHSSRNRQGFTQQVFIFTI
jgi:hypothetical protein